MRHNSMKLFPETLQINYFSCNKSRIFFPYQDAACIKISGAVIAYLHLIISTIMSIHLYRHLKSHLVDIYQVLRPLMKILYYTTYYIINNTYFCVVKHKNNYENEIYY